MLIPSRIESCDLNELVPESDLFVVFALGQRHDRERRHLDHLRRGHLKEKMFLLFKDVTSNRKRFDNVFII